MAKIRWQKWNRLVHYWGALACSIPVLIVTLTGVVLLLKKESSWIQPATVKGISTTPSIDFEKILEQAKTVPQAEISSWSDIKLLDVRPNKGVIKIRAKNRWEIQLDGATSEILQTAFRRSDIIEEMHDGSFFHDKVKLWIFLPSGMILFILWVTGMYLFATIQWKKIKNKRKARNRKQNRSHAL